MVLGVVGTRLTLEAGSRNGGSPESLQLSQSGHLRGSSGSLATPADQPIAKFAWPGIGAIHRPPGSHYRAAFRIQPSPPTTLMLTKSSRSLFRRTGAASCVFIALSNLGMGTSLYWDTDAAGGLQGGGGNWNTTDVNWAPNSDGSGTRVFWAADSEAHFEGSGAVPVTTSGLVSVNALVFIGTGVTGVTIQGGDLTMNNGTGYISAFNASDSGTINARIIGNNSSGITKRLDGTVTFGGDNTYSGPTNVQGGTLVINGNQSAATGLVTVAGGVAGARLSGIGTIGGSTTIAGIHAPGPVGGVGT